MSIGSAQKFLSWIIAVSTTAAITGCASHATSEAAAKPMASNYIAVGINGGEYRWKPPTVQPASNPDGRPEVAAGAGPDPVSGSVIMPLVQGTGPALTNPNQARIRYIHQSWDASTVVHDSWRNGGAPEALPDDDVGARIGL